MKKRINQLLSFAKSSTARDTYILFIGNVISAFLGFVFTVIIARYLSVADFGVFSASWNLILILTSLADVGISAGIVSFVSKSLAEGKKEEANKYIKSAFILRFLIMAAIAFVVIVFSPLVSQRLLATNESRIAVWVAVISVTLFFWQYFPYALQAARRFIPSLLVDFALSASRIVFVLIFIFLGGLTLDKVFWTLGIGSVLSAITGFVLVGTAFLYVGIKRKYFVELIKFSGWIGVNRVVSSISGRLDIQMLAGIVGATTTGFYSIPSKLAMFIGVLAASFSAVLAPRFSSFSDISIQKKYLKKASLAIVPIVSVLVLWIIVARPFIQLLFGDKYLPAVPIFQLLVISMVPFIIATPAVTAIIYGLRKTVYIGIFSFFQLAMIFFLNLVFIPKFQAFGPTYTLTVVNSILAIYSWIIILYYYSNKRTIISDK